MLSIPNDVVRTFGIHVYAQTLDIHPMHLYIKSSRSTFPSDRSSDSKSRQEDRNLK